MLRFRRRRNADTWHFHRDCADWPIIEFETAERPRRGFVCAECKARRRAQRPWTSIVLDAHSLEFIFSPSSPAEPVRR